MQRNVQLMFVPSIDADKAIPAARDTRMSGPRVASYTFSYMQIRLNRLRAEGQSYTSSTARFWRRCPFALAITSARSPQICHLDRSIEHFAMRGGET
jgi:hypothetical protein